MSKVSFNAVTACTNFIFPNATAFLEMERRLKLFEYVALYIIQKYIYHWVIRNIIYLIIARINSTLSRKKSLKSPVVAITIKTPYVIDRVDAQNGVITFEVTRNRNNPANIPPIYK